jgi:hypothetical protein
MAEGDERVLGSTAGMLTTSLRLHAGRFLKVSDGLIEIGDADEDVIETGAIERRGRRRTTDREKHQRGNDDLLEHRSNPIRSP